MRLFKRGFDIVFAAAVLALSSPFMLAIAAIIRLRDPGPVLYRAPRVGLGGRPFRMFKFRTMVVNADKVGGPSTSNDDVRVTPIGRWLRRYKLDELPQLFNVLRGEMSIVGPRPEVQQYVDLFSAEERSILGVRPGITDLASLWNVDEGSVLAGAVDPEQAYLELIRPTKVALQMAYVRRHSLALDCWIIGGTVLAMLGLRQPMADAALARLQQTHD